MRVIAIGFGLLLVAVTSASGARMQAQPMRVTQKALGVSLPAHGYPVGSFDKVACPSLGRCVASFGGPLMLSERGGK